MKVLNLFTANVVMVGFALVFASCSNNPESNKSSRDSSSSKWYGDCEGISRDYGSQKVSNAAVKLLERKVGRESSYRFWHTNVEVRGNCQFLVSVNAQADIGRPMEQLKVRIAWDGKEFYLVN